MRRFAVLLSLCAVALPVSAAGAWTWPVDGPVLRPFSFDRAHPYAAGQHRGHEGTRLSYTLIRLGTRQAIEVALVSANRPASMYFVLAGVGLFTLLVGASVRLRRPRDCKNRRAR